MWNIFNFLNKENREERKIINERTKFLNKQNEEHHKEVIKEEELNSEKEKIAPEGIFLSLQHINKIYDNHVQAVYDFNLDVKRNEFIVFVGPSGCGKSTTLRMIAGLEEITSGDLYIDGVYANNLLPKERSLSMVFQSYALYPHMSVYDNLAFGLKIKKASKEEIDKRVKEVSSLLEIEDYLDRKPKQLSGGQCQRVALGRAIMRNVPLFLMDEPLSNLDAKLRVQMRGEIVKLHNKIQATTIYVTHDQTEAMTMADRIVIMNKGYIQQIGTPEEIYNHPANSFVASFIGSPAMNIVKVSLKNNKIIINENFYFDISEELVRKIKRFYETESDNLLSQLKLAKDEFENELSKLKEKDKAMFKKVFTKDKDIEKQIDKIKTFFETDNFELEFGVRPEDIKFNDKTPIASGIITLTELLGSEYYLHIKLGENEFLAKTGTNIKFSLGTKFPFSIDESKIHLFSSLDGKSLI